MADGWFPVRHDRRTEHRQGATRAGLAEISSNPRALYLTLIGQEWAK
jgi:hypothetical protein